MESLAIPIACFALLGLVASLAIAVVVAQLWLKVPRVVNLPVVQRKRWPRLSVLIPACNEVETLGGALRSQLRTDYPDVEFIVVDDRSTDGTGAVIDRLAVEDARVVPLHVEGLPDGWLGKVHALARGVERATGDWVLVTDADVHIEPDLLRKVIAWAEQGAYDFVAALAGLRSVGVAVDCVLSLFMRSFVAGARFHAVEDPRSQAAVGIGTFNLMRQTVYDRSPGFEWLKLEVADDLGLAVMLKQAGAHCAVLSGRGAISITFYTGLVDMARKLEKNVYAILGRCSLGRIVAMVYLLLTLDFAALMAFVPVGVSWLPWVGVAALGLGFIAIGALNRWFGLPVWIAPLYPVGTVLLSAIALVTGWRAHRRGGIEWRGTFYSAEQLRAGSRIRFM